jgi:hypothetical protein
VVGSILKVNKTSCDEADMEMKPRFWDEDKPAPQARSRETSESHYSKATRRARYKEQVMCGSRQEKKRN